MLISVDSPWTVSPRTSLVPRSSTSSVPSIMSMTARGSMP